MVRALSSVVTGKERLQLIAARNRIHLSQAEVAGKLQVNKSTVHRWEKQGDLPQQYHLRHLCDLYGVSARELGFTAQELGLLGFEDIPVDVQTITAIEEANDVLALFRKQNLTSRLMGIIWNWSRSDARYRMLQSAIAKELEDNNTMTDEVTRRDALKFLALIPIDWLGLSEVGAVFKGSNEEILTHCAAAIVACWHLRKGKELAFADAAISKYIPTLKAIVQTASEAQRKAAADLLVQCLLLKSTLSRHIISADHAIGDAQQAEKYSQITEKPLLQIIVLRSLAAVYCNANRWKQALQTAQQAKFLLEERQKPTPSKPAKEPIPQLVYSYVYGGLAAYQAHYGQKQDALTSLKKAHSAFFAQAADEDVPIWIDHNIGNLLDNDGLTHIQLGLYKDAIGSFTQVHEQYAHDATITQACYTISYLTPVIAEASRDDQPRNMDWCIDHWKKGVDGAITLQSNQCLNEAIQAYAVMRAAWPAESRIKKLQEHIIRW